VSELTRAQLRIWLPKVVNIITFLYSFRFMKWRKHVSEISAKYEGYLIRAALIETWLMRCHKLEADDSPKASETHHTNQLIWMNSGSWKTAGSKLEWIKWAFQQSKGGGEWEVQGVGGGLTSNLNYSFATFIQASSLLWIYSQKSWTSCATFLSLLSGNVSWKLITQSDDDALPLLCRFNASL